MAECNRKEITQLLHAYELGLLSDEDRARVEQHIIECDHCFQEIERNAEAIRLIKFDPETRRQIREVTRESTKPDALPAARRSLWKIALPLSVVAGIVLLLVLKDWRVDIRTSDAVMAGENRCAILPFEELAHSTDGSRLGEVIADLLVTDLSQSSSLQIVSSQYLYDLTAQMISPDTSSRSNLPTRIAQRAGARWLLTGAITQTEPELTVTAQLVDVASGTVTAAVRAEVSGNRAVFQAVDKLSAEIRQALTASDEAASGTPHSVTEITTASVDAYREYMLGLDSYRKLYHSDAEQHFRQAISFDSAFAIPYYYLSLIVPGNEGRTCLAAAVAHLDRAGSREQYLIRSRAALVANRREEALDLLNAFVKHYPDEKQPLYQLGIMQFTLGEYISAARHFQEAIALDSAYGPAYNELAYTYDRLGDLESAIRAIDRYIQLSPDEANPYDSRGDIYARNGRIEPAIESYRLALQIKPDMHAPLSNLGMMYLYKEDYLRAESCFAASERTTRAAERASARLGLCYLPAYQGYFHRALAMIDSMIRVDQTDSAEVGVSAKLWFKAFIFEALGSLDSARQTMVQSLSADRITVRNSRLAYEVKLAVRSGLLDEARAWADTLMHSSSATGGPPAEYWTAEGEIATVGGLTDSAINLFEKAAGQSTAFSEQLCLARAYLDFGHPDKAVPILEKLSAGYTAPRQFWLPESVKLHYYLGQAYDALGWGEKAAVEYRSFLRIWTNADTEVAEIATAKDRLAKIDRKP
jgi:tetratricopeptide (TPR) repeat protein/TolB-like protein